MTTAHRFLGTLILIGLAATPVLSQEHHHGHESNSEPLRKPRVFLDKSPRIVWYQLNRLSNDRLLLVDRFPNDPKYQPVYEAILTRPGMSRAHREEALAGLVELTATDAAGQLLSVLQNLDSADRSQQRVGRELVKMLLETPLEQLREKIDSLKKATQAESDILRAAGYAGLIATEESELAWSLAKNNAQGRLDYLRAVSLTPSELRAGLRESILASLEASQPVSVRRAAIGALAQLPADSDRASSGCFRVIAPFVGNPDLQAAAIEALLRIPKAHRAADMAESLVDLLVKQAETTPAEQRTEDDFLNAMQLVDELMALIPVDAARSYRERLRAVTVRVVRIKTIQEEMRYDTRYFAVEAGRDVQVVLQNEDLMPHNFVLTEPGAIREVALAAARLSPTERPRGKQYVPDSDKILFATDMVQAGRQARLTFTAPAQPGEYPYVCTFPRHWMRMYGVMVVVEDLDAWLKDPAEPADPLGNNRSFVNNWRMKDLADDLPMGIKGRLPEIGQRLFKEAACAGCHKVNGQGGTVGPELTDVLKRYHHSHENVLREILDPSHKVDPKYAVRVIATTEGQVISGIVTLEDRDAITIITNPESPQPQTIKRDEIEEMTQSSISMMPKGLLDRFTKDEIFEILAYVTSQTSEGPHWRATE